MLSVAIVAAVMCNRAQMQVSIRVLDACTVNSAAGARAASTCNAQSDARSPTPKTDSGSARDRQTRAPTVAAHEEKTDEEFTEVVF